jgi:hypothetical protein
MPDGEGLEPRFGRFSLRVSERICKRRGSTFYFTKDTFDSIPISMATPLKSEPKTVQCSTEEGRTIDEEFGLFDGVFPLQFVVETTVHGEIRSILD